MSRVVKIPSYRQHSSGQAVVTLPVGGKRKDVLLGEYGSPASRQEYIRVIAEWNGRAGGPSAAAGPDLHVNELLLAFWRHAEAHYRRPDGRPTSELGNYRVVIKAVRQMYGHTRAVDFGPLALKTLRQQWVADGIVRRQVNNRVIRVRNVFRWAVGEQLLPVEVHQALMTVDGLKYGRSNAKESVPVRPVAPEQIEAVLGRVSPTIAAMIRVNLLTGARPGEICAMRWEDIDQTAPVWAYRPVHHKTEHHGKPRVVMIGPRAQAVMEAFRKPSGVVFSALAEVERQRSEKANARKTPRYPSHARRNAKKRKAKPRWSPNEAYTEGAYRRAVERACEALWPLPEELRRGKDETAVVWKERLGDAGLEAVRQWRECHVWTPNQLRHSAATAIRGRYGVEAAQVVLGHSELTVTQIYAEKNLGFAAKVAAEMG